MFNCRRCSGRKCFLSFHKTLILLENFSHNLKCRRRNTGGSSEWPSWVDPVLLLLLPLFCWPASSEHLHLSFLLFSNEPCLVCTLCVEPREERHHDCEHCAYSFHKNCLFICEFYVFDCVRFICASGDFYNYVIHASVKVRALHVEISWISIQKSATVFIQSRFVFLDNTAMPVSFIHV